MESILLRTNRDQTIYVEAVSGGSGVTGLGAGDFTAHKSVGGAAGSAVTISAVTEVDSANLPGFYAVDLPASEFSTEGFAIFRFTSGSFDTVVIKAHIGLRKQLEEVRALAGKAKYQVSSLTYDDDGNVTSSTIKGWAPEDDISTDPALVTLTVSAVYNADGQMTSFEVG